MRIKHRKWIIGLCLVVCIVGGTYYYSLRFIEDMSANIKEAKTVVPLASNDTAVYDNYITSLESEIEKNTSGGGESEENRNYVAGSLGKPGEIDVNVRGSVLDNNGISLRVEDIEKKYKNVNLKEFMKEEFNE